MTATLTALEELHQRLSAATRPEEIFGDLGTAPADELQRSFRDMARIAHPDRAHNDPELARRTFDLLMHWRQQAAQRLARGVYGTPDDEWIITSAKGVYHVSTRPTAGDYAVEYACRSSTRGHLIFRIAADPPLNPLVAHEIHTLNLLQDASPRAYFPLVADAFIAANDATRRQVAILSAGQTTHTLVDILRAFPRGIDPRDAAWMFNRLLEGLFHAHAAGIVHGAILSANLRLDVARHGMVLMNWGFSTEIGRPLSAISSSHETWYPPEVFARRPATPALDLYMAARCLAELLGANVSSGQLTHPDENYPAISAMLRFIKGCLLPLASRPADAGALREEFADLLKRLFGKPAFRPFAMPR